MSNTITLPRCDWEMITYGLGRFMYDHNLQGGSFDCIISNIASQLIEQEY
jgi:hypothetical protein